MKLFLSLIFHSRLLGDVPGGGIFVPSTGSRMACPQTVIPYPRAARHFARGNAISPSLMNPICFPMCEATFRLYLQLLTFACEDAILNTNSYKRSCTTAMFSMLSCWSIPCQYVTTIASVKTSWLLHQKVLPHFASVELVFRWVNSKKGNPVKCDE